MIRSLASLAAGLATAILINALAAIALRWPDMFWSLAWQWGLAARLYGDARSCTVRTLRG